MKIPLLLLDSEEAARLGAKLPKSAALHTQLTSPYEYKSVYYLRDGIPTKIDLRSRDRDLAKVDTTYHARFAPPQGKWGPGTASTEVQHTFVPGQNLSIRASHAFTTPATRTEYYTVPGNDVTWNRYYWFYDVATGGERNAGSYRGFTRGSKDTEDWNETILPTQILAGKDLPATGQTNLICDSCRQGDRLRLRSLGALGIGQFADASDPSHQYSSVGGTEEIHLYREGTELTPTYDSYGLPSYEVPAAAATYRLTDVYKDGFAAPHGGTTITTDWTFRSSRPKKATVAEPHACIDTVLFNVTDACAWQPLIQLSYDLEVAADDTARAGRPFDFTVRARTGAAKPIALRDLKVWISADGGSHWTRTTVMRCEDNAYRVAVTNPRGAGSVTIKTEATDHDGNSVRQTVVDAYLVR